MEKIWLKHYEPNVPHEVEIPSKVLPQLFKEAAQKYPNNIAATFMGNSITYQEMSSLIDNFSAVLSGLGLTRGSRVAIHLPNSPQFVIAYYGALQAGCIIVPCNPLYVERELEYQLKDADADIVITLSRFYPMVRRIKEKLNFGTIIATNIKEYFPGMLKFLYTLAKEKKEGDRAELKQGDYWLQDLLKQHSSASVPNVDYDMEDSACYLYTGGTTGVSKAAVLTHRNIVANVVQTRDWLSDFQEGKEINLAVLPFFHSYGMTTCLNLALVYGGKLILVPRFDLKEVIKLIDKEKPTLFPGVPTMYVAIINSPDIEKFDLSSIRACISGAAPLPVEVQSQFEKLTGGRLVEGYGLSESSPVTHANPIYGLRKSGSIGVPFPSTVAKVVDPENPDNELGIDESGELVVKGPQVMKGYLNKPEETEQVLRDGWLHTGDIAKVDEDGYFYIVDRKKDMVIAGGFNIFPREIEEVLYGHDNIQEAAVCGVPDPYRGETLKAYVVLKEGKSLTEEDIINYCTDNLAKYKVPKKVEFRDELPKTMIGKVLRRKLVEEEIEKQKNENEKQQ